ncbi:50S ribosomal protein L18 [Sulfolobus acidocaldarius SUSAZ]|nr:50S ribosomal protein L18 [Sulfolobus acidocaldarius SUSAZ]
MAQGPNYRIKFRRRREGKTDYYTRYTYVINNAIRFVPRLTNKYVIVSVSKFDQKGDIMIAYAHSIELVKKYGWKGDTNNTPAAYLTGYLAGLRAVKSGVKTAVSDIGLFVPVKGGRIFAVIKGAIDAGLKIPVGDLGKLKERVNGSHISAYAQKLKNENQELYNKLFSSYIQKGLDPVLLPQHFEEVLNKIKEKGGN